MEYLAKHNKVWQHIKNGEILFDKLILKDGEEVTDYRQIPKPKERNNTKRSYFNASKNAENKGVY